MPTPTASVKVNPLTGALIDPIAATFASANGFLTGGTSDAKDSVVCATTANGTLATAFENGDTVDGIVLATGNRILIKNQSSQAENGIYTVNASGAPTRATDFDSWTEIVGAFVSVESGTVNAGTQWLCNVVSGGTLGTTAINFVVPQNYVNLTLNQIVGGNKHFAVGSTIGGVEISKDTASPAVNGSIQFLEDNSIFALSASAGPLWVHTTGDTDVTFPLSGTLATTTGNVATATALATARNIFNISFDGTANVVGDATNTGHFASIPGTGAAGHFVTQNGTAPTLIAGRSAWYSDGSGVPSFKNGTGTAVTLVRSSDIGVSVQAYDADLTTWAGITPGLNVATQLADYTTEDVCSFREDFISGTNTDGSIGALGWRIYSTAGTSAQTYILGELNHPGIFRIKSGATSGNGQQITLAGSGVVAFTDPTQYAFTLRFIFRIDATTSVRFRAGFGNGTTAVATRFFGVRFDTTLADTDFMAVAYNSDGTENQASSLGVAANTAWHNVEIEQVSTTSIRVRMDGGAWATIASEVPFGTLFLSPFAFVETQTSAARQCDLDLIALSMTVSR